MNLEQTLEELVKFGRIIMGVSFVRPDQWFVRLITYGEEQGISSDLQPTPLAAAQQCLERVKNVN